MSIPPLSGSSPRTELGSQEPAPVPPQYDYVAAVEAGEPRHDSDLTDSTTRTDAPEVVKLARTVAFHDAPSSPSASSVRDRESGLESATDEEEAAATGTESEVDAREIGLESGLDGEEEQGSESGQDDEEQVRSESGREDQEEGLAGCMPDLNQGSGSGSESSQRARSCGSGNGNGNGESEVEDDNDADDGGVVVVTRPMLIQISRHL